MLAPATGRNAARHALTIQSPLTLGLFAGKWCSYAAGPDLAHDQRQEDGGALVFDTAPLEAPLEMLGAPLVNWLVHRDLALDESTLEVINDRGRYRLEDTGLEIARRTVERYVSRADAFTSVRAESETICRLERGDWRVKAVTRTVLTSSPSEFRIRADLDAWDGDRRFYCRSWDETVHRDLV